jgi:hypothetical protein
MPQHPGVWHSPNKTTIDASTDDDGNGLAVARLAYPDAGDHVTVTQAVGNILSGPAMHGRRGQFIGHGEPGFISMGCGTLDPPLPGTYIALDNVAEWEPLLWHLRGHVQVMRLLGCWVGARQTGADLLRLVACAIAAPVIAPTGTAETRPHEKIVLQDGSVWQIGQCNVRAHVIPMPDDPHKPPSALQFLSQEGEREAVPLGQVRSLDFTRTAYLGRGTLSLQGGPAQELTAKARLDEPQDTGRHLLAHPTGELRITYVADDGERHQRSFDLLGDVVLRDREAPTVTYRVAPEFREALPERPARERERPASRDEERGE